MTKSDYLSSSAKYFTIGTIYLFAVTLLKYISSSSAYLATHIGTVSQRLLSFSLYIFLIVAFLALNGEGIGQNKGGDRKAKKKIRALKWLLLLTFLSAFPYNLIVKSVRGLPQASFTGALMRYLVSLLLTVLSYSFLLLVISAWYLVRDKSCRKLQIIEKITLIFSAVFFVFKFLNTAAVTFSVPLVPDFVNTLFSAVWPIRVSCLLQYAADIVLFVMVRNQYLIFGGEEEAAAKKKAAFAVKAVSFPQGDGTGIDRQDDLWFCRAAAEDEKPAKE